MPVKCHIPLHRPGRFISTWQEKHVRSWLSTRSVTRFNKLLACIVNAIIISCVMCAFCRDQSVITSTTNALLRPLTDAARHQQNASQIAPLHHTGDEVSDVTHQSHESPSSTVDEHSSEHANGKGRLQKIFANFYFTKSLSCVSISERSTPG